jgi:ribosomal-protein-alanine N-acetyltransferase
MRRVRVRFQRLTDAERFFEILSNPRFVHLPGIPKTLEEERAFLRENAKKRREKREFNYAIVLDGTVIGAIGLAINRRSPHVGEIGYFVDEGHWGHGFAADAVRLVERIGFETLKLHRIEILMSPHNTASIRVAEKCGYEQEGYLRERICIDGKRYEDAYLYAKIES